MLIIGWRVLHLPPDSVKEVALGAYYANEKYWTDKVRTTLGSGVREALRVPFMRRALWSLIVVAGTEGCLSRLSVLI